MTSNYFAVAQAIADLLPGDVSPVTEVVELSDGQASFDALPWTVVRVRPPLPLPRSFAGTRLGDVIEVNVTVAAATFESVAVVYSRVVQALEQATPIVDGWACSPLREVSALPPVEDPDVTITGSNRRVCYTVVSFEMTVSAR